jgi:hypothetical protein
LGCLLRIGLAAFLAIGAAPWGAYLAATEPALSGLPGAPFVGLGVFAILGAAVGWVVGGVAWKALKAVVLAVVLAVALGLSWTGWTSWIDLPAVGAIVP